jgi:UDP-N-acetylglucosamine--N-acetylmuramyl-(pentapeptide) pyrophosphoryl-undecaprenol N-acetylglucosamine transferase
MTDVLLVGGGTAGHALPAIATAQALDRLRPELMLGFAGRSGSLEERLVGVAGRPFHPIRAVPLPRRPTLDILRVPLRLAGAVRAARALLVAEQVRAVVSFGGYVALPLMLAARGRVPVVLHEQNSRPGLANRIASRSAARVAVTFPSSIERFPTGSDVHVTGNPVQERLRDLDVVTRRSPALQRLGLDPSFKTLLVFGGSQGARSINRAVVAAADGWRALGLQVLHVTGEAGYESTLGWWDDAGIDLSAAGSSVRVVPFLEDMADAYAVADVVIARAGATTIAELSLLGIPSVLVPYPHATADHQRSNAEALRRVGAALVLDDRELTPDGLAAVVASIVSDPARAGAMALAGRAWARADAAEGVARLVLEVLEVHHG